MAFENLGGTAVAIPQIGEEYIPHGLYVAICRMGFGQSTADSYGDSNGLNRWTDTQETIPLFDINSTGIFVHQVTWDVDALFNSGVDLSLGDGQGSSEYATIVQIACTELSTGASFSDTSAGLLYHKGRRYGTTDSIDVIVATGDPSKGSINVYCIYSYAPEYPSPDTGGSANT